MWHTSTEIVHFWFPFFSTTELFEIFILISYDLLEMSKKSNVCRKANKLCTKKHRYLYIDRRLFTPLNTISQPTAAYWGTWIFIVHCKCYSPITKQLESCISLITVPYYWDLWWYRSNVWRNVHSVICLAMLATGLQDIIHVYGNKTFLTHVFWLLVRNILLCPLK